MTLVQTDASGPQTGEALSEDSGFDGRDMNGPSTFLTDTSDPVKTCSKYCQVRPAKRA